MLLRRQLPALLVLVLGAAITLLTAWQLRTSIYAKDEDRFRGAVDRLHHEIEDRIATYTDMLRAGAGLLDGGSFSEASFHAFARRLELQERYPGILGIGYSRRVEPPALPGLLAERRRISPGFRVWPDHPRDEYHAILALFPLDDRNQAAIGFDMFTDGTRRAAMERARDGGDAFASGPVQLVQEIHEDRQPGFLIYNPVYRGGGVPPGVEERRVRLEGFVYAAFRTGDLFANILASERDPRAGFALADAAAPEVTLYRTGDLPTAVRLSESRTITVAGRTWNAQFFPLPGLSRASSENLIPLVLWGGLAITLLLAGLVAMQTQARGRLAVSRLEAQEAAGKFQQLANSIPQLAWMARPDGWIYWYNDRWYEYTGTTPEEMQGWGWESVHDPAVLVRVVEKWKKALATGTPFEMEFPLRGQDGTFRWFLTRVVPLRDATGRIVTWFGTNTDVQALRDAERAARQQAEALEVVNRTGAQLAAELDLHRLVQSLTDAGVQLSRAAFGAFFYNVVDGSGETYTLHTLSGLPREAFAGFAMPRNTAVFGPTFRGEGIVRSDDITKDARYGHNAPNRGMPAGHPPVRSYLAVPVVSRSGEVLGGLFFGHSAVGRFTEQDERILGGVAAQAAIAIDNARLYNRVQDLLAREREARQQAERDSQLKDEFLATLSHELRTPLNAVLGWTHLLRQKGVPEDRVEHALETIERNAQVQSQLIDDLLDMSRIVSGRLRMEVGEVVLQDVLDAAVSIVRPAAEAKGVSLTSESGEPARLSADAARLQQVFWNLLSNAVKFTPRGGRVEVGVRHEESHVVVEVRDTGLGIPPEFLPFVFDRFRQADVSTRREYGGLGLGLSIARSLVDLHGGVITAESEGVGRGATFCVTLPATPR